MAFGLIERLIAFRYFRARRKESFVSIITVLSLVGITLGVATLIIVMSVFNGYRDQFMKIILGFQPHISITAPMGPIKDPNALKGELQQIDEIQQAIPIVYGEVLLTSDNYTTGVMVRGMEKSDFAERKSLGPNLKAGRLDNFQGNNAIIIGARLADRLRVQVGDSLRLISPEGNATPFGTIPRMKAYEIVGIVEVGLYEFDNRVIFMPMKAAQTFFKLPNAVTQFELTVKNPHDLFRVRQAIFDGVNRPVILQDWQQSNSQFLGAIEVEKFLMFIILTLVIMIASFNIISNLTMFVKDKSADIAILRTMGATRAQVLRIFFLNGLSLGFLGTFIGAVIGILFALNIEAIRQFLQSVFKITLFPADIYFLYELPSKIVPSEVAIICGISLLISFFATLYPAYRATKIDPVEALKYE